MPKLPSVLKSHCVVGAHFDNGISATSGARQIKQSQYLCSSEIFHPKRLRQTFISERYHPVQLQVEVVDGSFTQCHVSITLPTGAEIVFVLDPLLHGVDPERSSYQIHPSRLDIHLFKLHRGQHWQYLDDGDQPEHIPAIEPPSPSIVEDRELFGIVPNV